MKIKVIEFILSMPSLTLCHPKTTQAVPLNASVTGALYKKPVSITINLFCFAIVKYLRLDNWSFIWLTVLEAAQTKSKALASAQHLVRTSMLINMIVNLTRSRVSWKGNWVVRALTMD